MDRHSANHTQHSFIRVPQLFHSAHFDECLPSQANPCWLHQAQLSTAISCPWTPNYWQIPTPLNRPCLLTKTNWDDDICFICAGKCHKLTAHNKATHCTFFFFLLFLNLGQNIIFTAENSRTIYKKKDQASREDTCGFNGISSRSLLQLQLVLTSIYSQVYIQPRRISPNWLKFKLKLPLGQPLQTVLFLATLRWSTHKQLDVKAGCQGKCDVKELTDPRSLECTWVILKHECFSPEPSELESSDQSIWNRAKAATAVGDFTCAAVFRGGICLTNFHFTKSKKKAFKQRIIKT